MDMQNVTDLTITEGDVRTIHDSSDRLLWGKLSYNTYYAGNTTQQTYSGKNLYGMNQETAVGAHITWTKTGNTANGTGTSSGTWCYIQSANSTFTNNLSVGTYTMSIAEALPSPLRLQLHCIKSDNSAVNYTMLADATSLTFTTTDVITAANIAVTALTSGETYDITIKDFQLEAGSTPTAFEPYVGGVPAPNPDYPQVVNVVTGEQTITINDEDFTLNLGTTELCKIGNYQDYIYKSGDEWYVHQMVGNSTYSGVGGSYNSDNNWYAVGVPPATPITNSEVISNYFTGTTTSYMVNNKTANGVISITSNTYVLLRNTACTDLTSYRSWLSSHPTTIYYALATPTDTQITDTTLISQLNDINEWLTRYGYNYTVSGNLPLIIIQNNL